MFWRKKSPIINATEEFEAADQRRIDGARGAFEDSENRKLLPAGSKVFLIVGIVILAIAFVPIVRKSMRTNSAETAATSKPTDEPRRSTIGKLKLDERPVSRVEPIPVVPATPPPAPPQSTSMARGSTNKPGQAEGGELSEEEKLLRRRLASQLALQASAAGDGQQTPAVASQPAPSGARRLTDGGISDEGESASLSAKLTPFQATLVEAGMVRNQDFTLMAGTPIECILIDRIVTTQPGTVTCEITRDIWSMNRRVVLIDAGTVATGHYDSGLRHGQSRVFVSWDRLVTPQGVVVPIASPGVGQLGEAGLDGYVDSHWWERFGGTVMLSIIDDALATATTRSRSSDTTINFSSTSSNAQNMANEALRNSINIPPTLYKNQGSRVAIRLAQDLYFGNVYGLARR